ncbi:MAG: DUF885 domain-containing protein [Actinomycetota bacterium]|nr:DUF885 domain-containing protein [Actinomycetota bacterium]
MTERHAISDATDTIARSYLDVVGAAFPQRATELGLHDRDGELPEISAAMLDDYQRDLAGLRTRLAAIEPADAEGAADRDALDASIAEAAFQQEVERPWRRNPHTAASIVPNSVLLLLSRPFAPLEQRLADACGRLEAAPRLLEAARALLDEPCPPHWRDMAIAAANSAADTVPAMITELAADTALAARAATAGQAAAEALRGYAAWLADEHAPRFPEPVSYALGETALRRRLAQVHVVFDDPADLLASGEAEITDIIETMAEHAAGMGYPRTSQHGTPEQPNWVTALDDVKRHHPSVDGLVDAYRAEMAKLADFVFSNRIVTNPLPDAPVVAVEATPECQRAFLPLAAYEPPGPFDEVQRGHIIVTPPPEPAGLRDHSWASLQSVSAHEGYPGHHLQITSVNRLTSLTRKVVESHAMIEGWGLYAEQLMADTGYYDAAGRLGQLAMRLLRALRLVLDMGLQTGETTWEAGAERAVALVRMAPTAARNEVARYTMMPTHPFGFLTGCRTLERLRAETEQRQGDAFDLRTFHDRVLSYGHMPPPLMARALAAIG